MQLVRDVMLHQPAFVSRDATVRSVVETLRACGAETLPVLDRDRVVGLADALALTVFDGDVLVEEAMQPPQVLEADTPLSQAAMRMRSGGFRQLPVTRDGALVGLLSTRDLLSVWGHVRDPLTGLPVQHQFRRWVAAAVASGREVSILFLDINDFGELNKNRGHVYGDQVLHCVADVLRSLIDPSRDCLCRYGGDEFAIGTYRSLSEAEALAAEIRDQVSELCLADGPVTTGISIGISGGRRESTRNGSHPGAMLDELVTRASRASTRAKGAPESISLADGPLHAPRIAERAGALDEGNEALIHRRVVLAAYEVRPTGQQFEVAVTLRDGVRSREKRVFAREGEVSRALATATAECLRGLATRPIQLTIEETYEFTTPQGLECVGATVSLEHDSRPAERLVGTCPVRDDLHRTYIHAVLDATNRRLSQL